ncbi:MAG TPA: hypothetical protein DHW82_04990 [Spirochaetia bacterium]|nr:hypothetical protein [Spirochaetia bacterium]
MPAVAVSPAENTTVSYKSKVILTFTEPMNSGSIESSFSLKDNLGNLITGVLSFDSEKKIFTFTPSSLTAEKTYTAKIVKEAKDLNGNMLASDKTWTFTTDSTSNIYGDPEAVFGITRYGN